MKLSELYENPDNPSYGTDEDIARLDGKLKRVPAGLKAMRIAYVTDGPNGGKMVISGNKRLRVLKKQFGEDAELPDEYFQDVTEMSQAERHEFIVTANISDGRWDTEKLLAQYDKSELACLMDDTELYKLLDEVKDNVPDDSEDEDTPEEDVEVHSEEGKAYCLGPNVLICNEPCSCDELRKMYVQMRTGSEENWQEQTPEKVDVEQSIQEL